MNEPVALSELIPLAAVPVVLPLGPGGRTDVAELIRQIQRAAQVILDWDLNTRPQRPGRPKTKRPKTKRPKTKRPKTKRPKTKRPKTKLVEAARAVLDALQAFERDADAGDGEGMMIDLLNVGAAYQRFCIRYVEAA